MSEQTYLTRVRLRRDVPAAALRAVLLPTGQDERVATAHRLIWTLFSDSPDRTRDFLWREGASGEFYVLSHRPPNDQHGLFKVDDAQPFAPSLESGDRLNFALRVNATRAKSSGPGQRGKPCDIVMDAIYHAEKKGDRAATRTKELVPAAMRWLTARGLKHGFVIPGDEAKANDDPMHVGPIQVLGYHVMRVDRGRGKQKLSIGVLDLQGEIEVRDPDLLVTGISAGFGRAKAFGCGLMLIKRC